MIMQLCYGIRLGNNIKDNPKEYLNFEDEEIDLDHFRDKNLEIIECRNRDSVTHYLIVKSSLTVYAHDSFVPIDESLVKNDLFDSLIEQFKVKFNLKNDNSPMWVVIADSL